MTDSLCIGGCAGLPVLGATCPSLPVYCKDGSTVINNDRPFQRRFSSGRDYTADPLGNLPIPTGPGIIITGPNTAYNSGTPLCSPTITNPFCVPCNLLIHFEFGAVFLVSETDNWLMSGDINVSGGGAQFVEYDGSGAAGAPFTILQNSLNSLSAVGAQPNDDNRKVDTAVQNTYTLQGTVNGGGVFIPQALTRLNFNVRGPGREVQKINVAMTVIITPI